MSGKYLFALFVVFVASATSDAQQWKSLFNGQTLHGWVTDKGDPVNAEGWEVVDGMLHLDRRLGSAGNLLTACQFGDFELVFEWRVAKKGNNGIKYRVRDFDGRTLGLEYQVIDDGALPGLTGKHKTGSIYDIYEPIDHDLLHSAGEFNQGRIVVRGNCLEHWLNGCLITRAVVGSEQWNSRIAQSKFSDVQGFGRNRHGQIMITDHSDEVWYRNIFIRELSNPCRSGSRFVRHSRNPSNRSTRRLRGGWFRGNFFCR